MKANRLVLFVMALATAVMVTGCAGTGEAKTAGNSGTPATVEKTPIGMTALVTQGEVPTKLSVIDANGQKEILDLHDGPILVFAWWCPHCAALLARSDLPGLPRVVTVWPQQGQTLQQILQAEQAMMRAEGWIGDYTHGLFATETIPGVTSVPTLLYLENGKVVELKNENMSASDLGKSLGGKTTFSKSTR
ncbi:MAG TPA: hypothetical protein GX517_12410 [Alicyclobacillus sp.]|nr:hypothetical protein [Alicyclobacillus sp.]